MTGQHATKKRKDHHKQTPHDDPLRNSNNYLEKAEEKPDGKNSMATNHLATKCAHWRVIYNGKLRKINTCMKGILQIINILLTLCLCHTMLDLYKGFLTQCTTQ